MHGSRLKYINIKGETMTLKGMVNMVCNVQTGLGCCRALLYIKCLPAPQHTCTDVGNLCHGIDLCVSHSHLMTLLFLCESSPCW